MHRVRLIHWKAEEARPRIELLAQAGFDVVFEPTDPSTLRAMVADPPDAFAIDLTRLPSHGRDVALHLRGRQATRKVPIVFLGGAADKVRRTRKTLPDATFAEWEDAASAIEATIACPPDEPVVPASTLAGYSGTPLPKKLGIVPGSTVALVDAPPDFERTLGALPEGAKLRWGNERGKDVVILFTKERVELVQRVEELREAMPEGGKLWLAWPKKTSGVESDLSQPVVREVGLSAGLVDYKICSIDATWSGLLFTRRKKADPKPVSYRLPS